MKTFTQKNFKQALQNNVINLKRNLTDEILQKIADVRVSTLDNYGGFTAITQIIFKNCSILKQDAPLHGA